jgi:alpha-1,3-rhamnosyltransferase
VTFIALDDYLYPDALSKKIAKMDGDANIAFIGNGSISLIDSNGKFVENRVVLQPEQVKSIDDLLEMDYNTGSFYLQGSVIRKEIANAIGGFDEDMTGDDIVFRTKMFRYVAKHENMTFLIFYEPACYYRLHGRNVHKNTLRQIRIISEYLQKYWPDRELPNEYIQWAKHMIATYPYEEYMEEILYNQVSIRLLRNPQIISKIKIFLRIPMLWRINRMLRKLKGRKGLGWLEFLYRRIKKFRE